MAHDILYNQASPRKLQRRAMAGDGCCSLSTKSVQGVIHGYGALANAAQQTDLDVGAFFNAEFVTGDGNTVPEGLGVALSFCGLPS